MEREVSVTSGGKNIPMNHYVKKLIREICLILVDSLKKTEPGQEIVIKISPAGD